MPQLRYKRGFLVHKMAEAPGAARPDVNCLRDSKSPVINVCLTLADDALHGNTGSCYSLSHMFTITSSG